MSTQLKAGVVPKSDVIQRMKVPNLWGTTNADPLLIDEEPANFMIESESARTGPRTTAKRLKGYKDSLTSLAEVRADETAEVVNQIDDGFLIRKFGLDIYEVMALRNYGSPMKDDPTYFAYMGESKKWSYYESGWVALASAISKLPSFGDLGLDLPLFRVERTTALYEKLVWESLFDDKIYVLHGIHLMNFGQYHLQSTSLMPSNAHSAKSENYRKGLFLYKSTSARYMNNFSVQGLLDGGEALIPAGVISKFDGFQSVKWMNEQVTCAVLREVGTIEKLKGTFALPEGSICIEDFKAENVTKRATELGLISLI